MSQKTGHPTSPSERIVRDIRRATSKPLFSVGAMIQKFALSQPIKSAQQVLKRNSKP